METEIMRYLGGKDNTIFFDIEEELKGYLIGKGFRANKVVDKINEFVDTLSITKNPNYRNATSLDDIPLIMSWEICDLCAYLVYYKPYTTIGYNLTECINKLKQKK